MGGVAALIFLGWWGYRYHEGHAAYGLAMKNYAARPDIAFARNRDAVPPIPTAACTGAAVRHPGALGGSRGQELGHAGGARPTLRRQPDRRPRDRPDPLAPAVPLQQQPPRRAQGREVAHWRRHLKANAPTNCGRLAAGSRHRLPPARPRGSGARAGPLNSCSRARGWKSGKPSSSARSRPSSAARRFSPSCAA